MGRSHHTLDAPTPCAESVGPYTPHCTAPAAGNYNTYPNPPAFLALMAAAAYGWEAGKASTYPPAAQAWGGCWYVDSNYRSC